MIVRETRVSVLVGDGHSPLCIADIEDFCRQARQAGFDADDAVPLLDSGDAITRLVVVRSCDSIDERPDE